MKNILILLLITIFGIQFSESEQTALVKTNALPLATSENELFSVNIVVPEAVEANESFTINVELNNLTERAIEITTGDPVFYYLVRDSSGKAMNTITRQDVGIVQLLEKKDVLTEKYPYRFKKPGVYEISAVAEFSLHVGDGKSRVYKMETDWKKIKVIE